MKLMTLLALSASLFTGAQAFAQNCNIFPGTYYTTQEALPVNVDVWRNAVNVSWIDGNGNRNQANLSQNGRFCDFYGRAYFYTSYCGMLPADAQLRELGRGDLQWTVVWRGSAPACGVYYGQRDGRVLRAW